MQTDTHQTRDGSRSIQQLLEQREQRIRLAAYFRAEQRGFAPGHALDDWLAAEQEEDEKSRPLTAD
jgi:hypothetical protein